jgi:hypothetical protein
VNTLTKGSAAPIDVALAPDFDVEKMPMAASWGDRARIRSETDSSLDGADLWIEKSPARTRTISSTPGAVFGKYRVYGRRAAELGGGTGGNMHWSWHAEDGVTQQLPPSPLAALEFFGDNPPAGAVSELETTVMRGEKPQTLSMDLRAPYGHGFRRGRVQFRLTCDDKVIFEDDIGSPSRWIPVNASIPAGTGSSMVKLAVIAQPGIEPWGWGRAATVLVRDWNVSP